jgi:hypothetical protein
MNSKMTNDEHEVPTKSTRPRLQACFVIRVSGVIRHSSFVIRHYR